MTYILIFIGICLFSLLFYMVFIEPHRLKEKHFLIRKQTATVTDISKAFDLYEEDTKVKIAHITDLHFSRWYKPYRINRIIRSTMQNKPDIVIFTGDLVDNYAKWPRRSTKDLIEKLKKLQAPMGKIAVLGNHDYKNDGHYFVMDVLKKAGFTVLRNEEIFGSTDEFSINITGLDDGLASTPNFEYPPSIASWNILLGHEPDLLARVKNLNNYDLALSGHSHGGQIRFLHYRVKNKGAIRYSNGIYLIGEQTILSVSSGVGTTLIPARLGVPPEMIYYHLAEKKPTLQPKESDEETNEEETEKG